MVRMAWLKTIDFFLAILGCLKLPDGHAFVLHGRLEPLHSNYLIYILADIMFFYLRLAVPTWTRDHNVVLRVEDAARLLIEAALFPFPLVLSEFIVAVRLSTSPLAHVLVEGQASSTILMLKRLVPIVLSSQGAHHRDLFLALLPIGSQRSNRGWSWLSPHWNRFGLAIPEFWPACFKIPLPIHSLEAALVLWAHLSLELIYPGLW